MSSTTFNASKCSPTSFSFFYLSSFNVGNFFKCKSILYNLVSANYVLNFSKLLESIASCKSLSAFKISS